MHTRHVEHLLPDYAADRLDDATMSGIERHLTECSRCRSEAEMLRETFRALAGNHIQSPSSAYFPSILPRVRERLEDRRMFPRTAWELGAKLALPLAVAVLAIVLLSHVRVDTRPESTTPDALRAVIDGIEAEELVDIALDQLQRQTLEDPVGESEATALLAEPILRGGEYLSDSDLQNDRILENNATDGLEHLSDAEVETILVRLSERLNQ